MSTGGFMSDYFDNEKEKRLEKDFNNSDKTGNTDNTEKNKDSCSDEKVLLKSEVKEDKLVDSKDDEIKSLKKEIEDLKDKWLRAKAEVENTRKATERIIQEEKRKAKESSLISMIQIADQIDLTLKMAKESRHIDGIIDGLELVQKKVSEILSIEGLKTIDTKDADFDPNYHEAIANVETDETPPGKIVAELFKGYTFNDRLIRPSQVIVSIKPKSNEEKNQVPSSENDNK